ncbi:FtsX-like permease family protein [Patulibacter brassicae]|uniref:FtsX-like permease family protein n=1 Tax=Patulibacter brassicae TaxID=1705717 RepID=A0ABU4VIE9_9ACTN|nr:FtsX-like permease family protein [Patulibacter brassicae]MDX8150919.1 FtsX-like permease family protein [Patulibacter brassicae]
MTVAGLRRRRGAPFRALLRLWRAELRAHRGRVLATGLAVGLGAALLVAALVVGDSARSAIRAGAGVELGGPAAGPGRRGADVVLRTNAQAGDAGASPASLGAPGTGLGETQVADLRRLPGVERVGTLTQAVAAAQVGDRVRGITVESLADEPSFVWQQLEAGRSPAAPAEIAVSPGTLDALRIRLGDQLAIGRPGVGRARFTVVGVLDLRGSLRFGGAPYGVVTPGAAQALARTTGPTTALLRAAPGTTPQRLVEAVNARAPVAWPETASALREASLGANADRVVALGAVGTAFAAMGLLVAALVLGTTATVALASRRRTLALLRALGAPRGLAVGLVVLEVVGVALAAAVVGTGVGVLLARLALPAAGAIPGLPAIEGGSFTVAPEALAGAVGGAVLLAVLAAAVPALWVARIRPAEALREAPGAGRSARVARAAGPILLVLGTAAAVLVEGWAGLVLAAALLVPGTFLAVGGAMQLVAGGLGRRARRRGARGVLGHLVAREIGHGPGRAAAEAVAVVAAVALVSATWIGSASVAETASARLARTGQPDLTLGVPSGSDVIAPQLRRSLRDVRGVAAVVAVRSSPQATVVGQGAARRTRVAGGVAAVSDRALRAVLPASAATARGVGAGEVALPRSDFPPFPEGARVALRGPSGTVRDLRVRYVRDLPLTSLVRPDVLERVARRTAVHTTWIRLDDGAGRTRALDEIVGLSVLGGPLPLDGPALADARVTHAIQTARTAATALLALAILVATIGAAATFALSVAERRRDHATLRAIGLDRERLRRLLLRRVLVVLAVGTGAGVLLGGALATVLVDRLAHALGIPAVHVWPVLPIAGLVAVVLLVARAAALLPLERAAHVAPARALAEG